MNDELAKIAIFQKKEIRKQLHAGEWRFVLSARDEELSALFEPVKKGDVQIEPPLPWSLIL